MTRSTTTARADSAGVGIAYETIGGNGPRAVLVHGLGYGRWGWGPIVEELARRLHLILVDNRGVGESDAPPGPYSAAQMAADVVAVIDDAGWERTTVIGASLGGMIAQELALAHPTRVERLVLCSTTPGGARAHPLPEKTRRVLAGEPAALPVLVENAFAERTVERRPELVARVLALRERHRQEHAAWSAQAAASASFDAFDRLAEIAAPTLVVHGGADRVVDPRNAELLAERIPGARLELIAGCGHLVAWERPLQLARIIGDFVSAAPA